MIAALSSRPRALKGDGEQMTFVTRSIPTVTVSDLEWS
jgi:hypothetical protein